MKTGDLIEMVNAEVRAGRSGLEREVRGGYASDLLSDVLAHAREGDVWITLQTHQNIVAVASMKGLAGIILVNGREPEQDTCLRAEQEGIPILVSSQRAFELVGQLCALGIGRRENAGEGQ